MAVESYPLCWPAGWKRISAANRKDGHFNKKERVTGTAGSYMASRNLSVSDGVQRILDSLSAMGVDRQDVIISTNVRTRLDGLPRSGEKEPIDPGAAAYWRHTHNAPMRCMAIDRYTTVADNLAAVAASLDALRTVERHGGAEILDRAFTGFKALEAENSGPSWWKVLEVTADATVEQIETAFKRAARTAHPDIPGGSHDVFAELSRAKTQGIDAARSRS